MSKFCILFSFGTDCIVSHPKIHVNLCKTILADCLKGTPICQYVNPLKFFKLKLVLTVDTAFLLSIEIQTGSRVYRPLVFF